MRTWRDIAKPIIKRVLAATRAQPMKERRRALHDAYPFGERKYWPYKIWCHEIRVQLGLTVMGRPRTREENPNQLGMFE